MINKKKLGKKEEYDKIKMVNLLTLRFFRTCTIKSYSQVQKLKTHFVSKIDASNFIL